MFDTESADDGQVVVKIVPELPPDDNLRFEVGYLVYFMGYSALAALGFAHVPALMSIPYTGLAIYSLVKSGQAFRYIFTVLKIKIRKSL